MEIAMQFEKTYTCIENENQTNAMLARGINTTVQSGNRLECVRNHMLCEIAIRTLSARPSGEQARIYCVACVQSKDSFVDASQNYVIK